MSEIDRRLFDRLYGSLATDFEQFLETETEILARLTESPIEYLLGGAIQIQNILFWRLARMEPTPLMSQSDLAKWPDPDTDFIIPQFEIEGIGRVDFLITRTAFQRHRVAIECDGHDFHERTKEQARRDRERDRLLQERGIHILRFTGSEIYKSPSACAQKVWNFFSAIDERAIDQYLGRTSK